MTGEAKLKLREFFNHCREGIRMKYYANLLRLLSPQLQKDLAMRVHGPRMRSIGCLNASSPLERDRFLSDIAVGFAPAVFPPQEVRARARARGPAPPALTPRHARVAPPPPVAPR